MESTEKYERLRQSKNIATVGCIGLVVVLILLYMIGIAIVGADLRRSQSEAIGALGRMRSQIEKAPGVLERMLEYGCGIASESEITELKNRVEKLGDKSTYSEFVKVQELVDSVRAHIEPYCGKFSNDAGFLDLKTELEGVNNRYFVELGKYRELATAYNLKLESFPGSLLRNKYKELESGGAVSE
ncbi:MAG: hypothetical protein ABIC40_02785 [bacterium]